MFKNFTFTPSHLLTGVTLCLAFLAFGQPSIGWQKSMGGSHTDIAHAITIDSNGDLIVVGGSYSTDGDVMSNNESEEVWLVKLNQAGNVLANRTYGGSSDDTATDIKATPDGGFIFCGYSYSTDGDVGPASGLHDYWVVKLDANLNIVWQKTMGGLAHDRARSVDIAADGGYIVAGQSGGAIGWGTGWDYWVIKFSVDGEVEWQKALGGTNDDLAMSVQSTHDGGFMVGGFSYSNDGNVTHHLSTVNSPDYWIVKLDSEGTIQWEKALGGNGIDYLYDIIQTNDHGYAMIGRSLSTDGDVTSHHNNSYGDAWVVKLSESGEIEWNRGLGGYYGEIGTSIIQAADGNYICAINADSDDGDLTANYGPQDCWIVKLNQSGNIMWQKNYGSMEGEEVNDIIELPNGKLVFVGHSTLVSHDVTFNHGYEDYWIVALDPTIDIDEQRQTQLTAFPNPTGERCTVRTTQGGVHPYQLMDVSGRSVRSGLSSGFVFELDMADLGPGLYFLTIEGSTISISKK